MGSHRAGHDLVAEQQHHLDSWDTVKAGASLAHWPPPLWTSPMSWVSPDGSLGERAISQPHTQPPQLPSRPRVTCTRRDGETSGLEVPVGKG